MNNYIREAREFLQEARAEFKRGEEENNIILMREACEKAWGATVQAINALFVKMNLSPLPKTHRERRLKLQKLEKAEPLIKEKAFLDCFMARDHLLHERAFYDGDIVPYQIEAEFEKVDSFIRDIESLEFSQ